MKISKILCFVVLGISLFAQNTLNEENIENMELFKLSNQIRGSNYECEGYKYIKSLQKYQNQILQAYNNPEKYLQKSVFSSQQAYENSLKYFEYWGYQSIGNYRLYEKFIKEREKEFKNFKNTLINPQYAINLIQIFEKRAFGVEKFAKNNVFLNTIKQGDSGDIKAYIIKNSPDIVELTKALQVALLLHKDIDILHTLIEHGAKINEGYESAIFFALDYPMGLMFLIENKADVNYQNFFGKTPLFYALENNNKQSVEMLLNHGAFINHDLISINELDVVGAHLPYYMKTCSFIHGRKNIFMHASSYADEDMLKLLIKHGAKYDVVDDMGFNALDFAMIDENEKTINYLKSLGLKSNKNINPTLSDDEIFFNQDDDKNQ